MNNTFYASGEEQLQIILQLCRKVEPEFIAQTALYARHRIEVPVFSWPQGGGRILRVSAQLYNRPGQYRRLADALAAELPR